MKLDVVLDAVFGQLKNPQWRKILMDAPRIHLAFLREPYLQLILDGKKTIESRFSMTRCLPWRRIGEGDVVLLKRSGGPIVGLFVVEHKSSWEILAGEGWDILKAYSERICADEAFWKERKKKRYATLIWITQVQPLDPIQVDKIPGDRRAWIVLREAQAQISIPAGDTHEN